MAFGRQLPRPVARPQWSGEGKGQEVQGRITCSARADTGAACREAQQPCEPSWGGKSFSPGQAFGLLQPLPTIARSLMRDTEQSYQLGGS